MDKAVIDYSGLRIKTHDLVGGRLVAGDAMAAVGDQLLDQLGARGPLTAKMKPMRQIEPVELMSPLSFFSLTRAYARVRLKKSSQEAVPSAAKVAFLDIRTNWEAGVPSLREPSRQLQISLTGMLLEESTPIEVQRVFAELAQDRPDAIMVDGRAELIAHHQLIVELANKSRLPAMYPWRDYTEAGGLLAYGADLGEAGRRSADDVHEILNGTKPGDIPIYRATRLCPLTSRIIHLPFASRSGHHTPICASSCPRVGPSLPPIPREAD
jgi:hypothetical protein